MYEFADCLYHGMLSKVFVFQNVQDEVICQNLDSEGEPSVTLNYLVWTFRSIRCSDSRDRVYAFLSLTRSWQAISIEADYTKSFEDI
jgi:hypothetical protein